MATISAKRGTSLFNPKATSAALLCLCVSFLGCDADTEAGQGATDAQGAEELSESRAAEGVEAEDAPPRVEEPDWEEAVAMRLRP